MARVTRRGGHVIALNEGTRAVVRAGDAPDQAEERTYGINEHVHTLYAYLWAFGKAGLVVRRVEQATATTEMAGRRIGGELCGSRSSAGAPRPGSRRPATATRARACSRGHGRVRAWPDEDRRLPTAGSLRARRRRDLHGRARAELRARPRGGPRQRPVQVVPRRTVLTQAFLWRLLDLTEVDGRPIDLVIATKFPSYVVRHPKRRVWLVHQFRQAYELDGTELGQFGRRRRGPRDRAADPASSTASRSARHARSSPPRGTSPAGSSARPGSSRGALPAAAAARPTAARPTRASSSP